MMKRWLHGLRWQRSRRFENAVSLAVEELLLEHGDAALDQARRKARPRDQPTRREGPERRPDVDEMMMGAKF
ncbi:hypothetical protein [Sphingobium scionense]|uniref:Uncharacterized protein n=1 Tax=Sphingobium scionense TaxID=1404341 RepID=A0A7W6LTD8_9SPHN|nr:hypothetical protein [Sphingobium scionense]MBB4150114.1 hypothetical protein [Sphingobium scionense]